MSSKAQVTLFIILGLSVLMLVGIVIYITSQDISSQAIVVPSELRPVYDFVKSCLEQGGKESLMTLGVQGGYISIPARIERDPPSYVFQDSGKLLKTPLWYHNDEDRSRSDAEVQAALEGAIAGGLGDCLSNFSGLESYGVIQLSEPKVKVVLTDEDVLVKLSLPLSLDLLQGSPKLEQFEASLPVKLKSILKTASTIHKSENEGEHFENITMGLIGMNPETPLAGLDFSCSKKSWRVRDVEESLKRMLELSLPRIRVKNTKFEPFERPLSEYRFIDDRTLTDVALDLKSSSTPKNVPPDAYEYAHLYRDMGLKSSQPVSVAITYFPEWGMDFLATPNKDGLLVAQKKGDIPGLNSFCPKTYQFSYTLRVPVMITIRDESAFHGEGYSFSFATPILIKNNEGRRDPSPWKNFASSEEDESFCTDGGDDLVTIRALGFEEGFPVASPLGDVNVSYECAGRFCSLDKTTNDGAGSYELKTYLPGACSPATITVEKEGYLSSSVQLDPDQTFVQIPMKSIREFDINVIKHSYLSDRPDGERWGQELPLGSSNNVTIRISHDSFTDYIVYPAKKKLKLVDGTATYQLDAFLTTYDRLRGGFVNPSWTVNKKDLDGKDTITLHVVEYKPYDKEEDLSAFLYEGSYAEKLSPSFGVSGS